MDGFELKRNDITVQFKGKLLLAINDSNVQALRKLCQEYGACATFSSIIKTKKDIDFEGEEVIATLSGAKLLADLEKNESVKAFCIEVESPDFKKVVEKTTKPIIALVKTGNKLKNIKFAQGVLVEGSDEQALDYKLVEKIKKEFQIPIISRSKLITPEEIYGVERKTESDAVALGDIAFRQPVIFEQTTNYFEKGYYNKITRKRREKTVELFEELYARMENQNQKELNKFKDIFMTE